MYPAYNQEDPNSPNCAENFAYPAAPDSEYGWEKLFSKRLYLAFGWASSRTLREGIEKTYAWIEEQVRRKRGENHLMTAAK